MATVDGKGPPTPRRVAVSDEQRLPERPNIIMRNAKHFCREDGSVVNRHSYHGTVSPLSSPIARDRFGSLQKRYIHQLRYPGQLIEAYSYEHIAAVGEQICPYGYYYYERNGRFSIMRTISQSRDDGQSSAICDSERLFFLGG
uniref:Rhs family protein n=1 Tax=Angiostrongylus cantonensis TaxID=6313 RepID=A0A0K0CSY9_ANGCA